MATDLKPRKRHRASQAEWVEIRDSFRGEGCWCCGGKWTDLHHILSRSHSGDDVEANLAPLCAECHRRVEARDPVARSLLRQALMPSNLAYLRRRVPHLEGWLDRNYAVTA